MSQDFPLIIVGGNGPVGYYCLQQLAAEGLKADVVSRRPISVPEGFAAITLDLGSSMQWTAPKGTVVISFLPLWILTRFLPRFADAKTIIATSSTSRYSKADSGDLEERSVAINLKTAEETLRHWTEQKNINWTLLRPTMIYNCRNDQNVTRMARFIRRWRFLPLAAPATGLRQPIHSNDVAKAAIKCLNNPATTNKAFNIAGGEVLSYRTMAERIFTALGQKPRFVMLPATLLQKGFQIASHLGILRETNFGASMFQRMNEDLVFDVAEGLKVLDYQPRSFKPEFSAML